MTKMPVSAAGTSYDLNGPPGAPVVVLIHGLGLTRDSTWGMIAPKLARHFRVLNYDLCGHGQSVLPKDTPSLKRLSEQLITLMDELKISHAALAGFSLGGMINRRVAMDHVLRVSALCILNSPHEREAQAQKRVQMQARDAGSGGPGATLDAALKRWLTPEFHRDHAGHVALLRNVVLANDPENYAAHRRVLAEGVVELIRPYPAITQPALIMTCEHDSGSTPAMSHAISSEIEGSQTIIVPGLQHLGLIEDPDAFTRPLIAFLARVLL